MTDIVVIFCASLLGFVAAQYINKQLRSRERLYGQLYQFIVDLQNNVQYEKLTIVAFVNNSNSSYKQLIQNLLDTQGRVDCSVSKAESVQLQEFVNGLSATNSSSMLEHLRRYGIIFDKQYQLLHSSNKVQCSVNVKVGILLGAVLALLLI